MRAEEGERCKTEHCLQLNLVLSSSLRASSRATASSSSSNSTRLQRVAGRPIRLFDQIGAVRPMTNRVRFATGRHDAVMAWNYCACKRRATLSHWSWSRWGEARRMHRATTSMCTNCVIISSRLFLCYLLTINDRYSTVCSDRVMECDVTSSCSSSSHAAYTDDYTEILPFRYSNDANK